MDSAPTNESGGSAAAGDAPPATGAAEKAADRADAKKSPAKKSPAKKAAAQKSPAKNATAKQAAAGKGPAKTSTAKKSPGKSAPARKGTAKKAAARSARNAASMQAGGRSGGSKRSLGERFGRGRKTSVPAAAASSGPGATSPGRRTPAKKAAARKHARRLVVREDEAPWTPKELQEVRGNLQADAKRLQSEIAEADKDVRTLMRDNGDGAGNDQADVGSNTFERDHEMAIVAQHREMLEQVERALSRIHDGSYGICERCGNPIGKMRLMAFPRATLCVPCKQREERR